MSSIHLYNNQEIYFLNKKKIIFDFFTLPNGLEELTFQILRFIS